jgi:hypothetical protein
LSTMSATVSGRRPMGFPARRRMSRAPRTMPRWPVQVHGVLLAVMTSFAGSRVRFAEKQECGTTDAHRWTPMGQRPPLLPGGWDGGPNRCMGSCRRAARSVPSPATSSGSRRSKQGFTPMQADGRGYTRIGTGAPAGRGLPGFGCAMCAVKQRAGPRPIGVFSVYPFCICVESFLLCRVPHGCRTVAAREASPVWRPGSAMCLMEQGPSPGQVAKPRHCEDRCASGKKQAAVLAPHGVVGLLGQVPGGRLRPAIHDWPGQTRHSRIWRPCARHDVGRRVAMPVSSGADRPPANAKWVFAACPARVETL